MEDRLLQLAIQNAKAVNTYYVNSVCSRDAKAVIEAHTHLMHRIEDVCFITAAAFAWLISGRDVVPPFSGTWGGEKGVGSGRHRVVAYRRGPVQENDEFEDALEHVVLVYDERVVIDSHFMRSQPAAMLPMSRLNEFDCYENSVVYFESSPGMDQRLEKLLKDRPPSNG